ncbi:MAG: ribonuclease III [Bacteroidales bacterium]
MLRGVFTFLIYLFRKDKGFYYKLIGILGFLPGKMSLYRIAFTHRSVSYKLDDGSTVNNERLEYLGDALLGAVASEFIYHTYDHTDEGYMTKLRARIVKRKHLNTVAIKMGIPALLSSHPHTVKSSKHLYGNALEALIGAIYLDKGYRCITKFFEKRMVRNNIELIDLEKKDSDYKSQLIEWAQKTKKEVVFFSHLEYDKIGKTPAFRSTVQIEQVERGTGSGDSKKEAEQQAASIALKYISV